MAKRTQPKQAVPPSKWLIGATVSVLAILMIIFVSIVWLNRYIFDTHNFTALAAPALTSQSSTRAVANEIADTILEDRPVLQHVLNDRLVTLIAALLSTDPSDRLAEKTVSRLQTTVISKDPQSVVIDLSGLKSVLSQLLTFGRAISDQPQKVQRIEPESIPDGIVLLNAKDLPNIHSLGVTLMWLAPLIFVAIILLIAYPLYRVFRAGTVWVKRVLLAQGGALVIAGIIAITLGPLFKPIALSSVENTNARTVLENVYDVFAAAFNSLAVGIIFIPAIALLLAAMSIQLWPRLSRYASRSASR